MPRHAMSFEDFAASSYRSRWVYEDGLQLYVRRSVLPGRGDFELASVSARHPGRGTLTRFLDKWEPVYSFFVENASPRLGAYLIRRGYRKREGHSIDDHCYIKEAK